MTRFVAAAPTPADVVRTFLVRLDGMLAGRWRFCGLLAVATFAGFVGGTRLHAQDPEQVPVPRPEPAGETIYLEPALQRHDAPGAADPRGRLQFGDAALLRPVTFDLDAAGTMTVEGTIDRRAAARFRVALERHGDHVRSIDLNSPGGSLDDAIAMAKLVRGAGLATEVADGALCASSCPLLLAGGVERRVAAGATVGLHQFYADGKTALDPAQAMADAQATAARIARHLDAMGVDPALWLHALDTPPRSLYRLSAAEMEAYRLVTGGERTASTRY